MRHIYILLFLLVFSFSAQANSNDFRIIVNADNPTNSVSRSFLADVFLKNITVWENKETILPVDLVQTSGVRQKFSNDIIHRSVVSVRIYWQERVFSGRSLPPPEMEKEEDIVEYVITHKGSVGYVGVDTNIKTAKVIGIN